MPNFELGKYVVYIVPAYLIALLVIAIAIAETLARTARWRREVQRLEVLRAEKNKA